MRVPIRLGIIAVGLAVATGGCAASRPSGVRVLPPRLDTPSSGLRVLPPRLEASRSASVIADAARAYLGTPYQLGGTTPAGFDCSGLVWYVFAQSGTSVPRDLRRQFEAGMPIAQANIEPGDLLFFSTTAPGPTHVGIAVDGEQFIHAPNSRGVVRVDRLSSTYWAGHFIGARRIL